jgi:hypothetical protein
MSVHLSHSVLAIRAIGINALLPTRGSGHASDDFVAAGASLRDVLYGNKGPYQTEQKHAGNS